MRLLTGRDRIEYDRMLRLAGQAEACAAHLEHALQEAKQLRAEHDRERRRADNAVDQLLAERGIPPVTPADAQDLRIRDIFRPDPDKVKAVEEQYRQAGFGAER